MLSSGTKYNDGNPEVNASCIGMAKVGEKMEQNAVVGAKNPSKLAHHHLAGRPRGGERIQPVRVQECLLLGHLRGYRRSQQVGNR